MRHNSRGRLIAVTLFVAAACCAQDRIPSPSGELFAQYTSCSVQDPCTPEVVITRPDGSEIRRFQVGYAAEPCASVLEIHWVGEKVVGAVCHGNPSLNFYFEMDVASGKVLHEYLGYGFVRSPDNEKLAHVGWIIHFAPPWVKSEYLQAGDTILYPLPPGMKPVVQKSLEMAPDVVTHLGLVYRGVHEFTSGFVWSPDSRLIGLVDCLVDYRLRDHSEEAFQEGGVPENRRCFAVAVGLDGTFRKTPVPAATNQEVVLTWPDRRTLVATSAGKSVRLQFPN